MTEFREEVEEMTLSGKWEKCKMPRGLRREPRGLEEKQKDGRGRSGEEEKVARAKAGQGTKAPGSQSGRGNEAGDEN